MPDYDDELHGNKYDYNPQAVQSPSDNVADYMNTAGRKRVTNPDDVIGMCSECKSEMPHSYMVNNVFAQEGVPVPCRYCGGVCVITYRELAESIKDTLDGNRGIGMG